MGAYQIVYYIESPGLLNIVYMKKKVLPSFQQHRRNRKRQGNLYLYIFDVRIVENAGARVYIVTLDILWACALFMGAGRPRSWQRPKRNDSRFQSGPRRVTNGLEGTIDQFEMFWKSLDAAFQRNSLADALVYNIELDLFFKSRDFYPVKSRERERKILTLLALAG